MMKHIKLRPEFLRIMGRQIPVSFVQELNVDGVSSAGCFDNHAMAIDVCEDQCPAEEADTLIHEAMHAIWYLMDIGQPFSEEFVVRKLATGLMQVFLDNPNFLKYLAAVHNK